MLSQWQPRFEPRCGHNRWFRDHRVRQVDYYRTYHCHSTVRPHNARVERGNERDLSLPYTCATKVWYFQLHVVVSTSRL